jgi:hypothetical protein
VIAFKKCWYCDRPISLYRLWTRSNFCSKKHEDLYLAQQVSLAMARIINSTGQGEMETSVLASHQFGSSPGHRFWAAQVEPQIASRTLRASEPVLLRHPKFPPVAWTNTRLVEPEPAACGTESPALPFLPSNVRPEAPYDLEIPMTMALAVIPAEATLDEKRTLEVLEGWPFSGLQAPVEGATGQQSLSQNEVIAAEMRSGFCLGPAGVIQVLTAVFLVKDGAVTRNQTANVTVSLANLLEAVSQGITTPNHEAAEMLSSPELESAKRSTCRGKRHAAGASPNGKPAKKKALRPKKP